MVMLLLLTTQLLVGTVVAGERGHKGHASASKHPSHSGRNTRENCNHYAGHIELFVAPEMNVSALYISGLQVLVSNADFCCGWFINYEFVFFWHLLAIFYLADTKFCYYDSLAARRPGKGRFEVGNIDPYACTHVAYAFVGVTENGLVAIGDPFVDVLQGTSIGYIQKCKQ